MKLRSKLEGNFFTFRRIVKFTNLPIGKSALFSKRLIQIFISYFMNANCRSQHDTCMTITLTLHIKCRQMPYTSCLAF